AKFLDEKGQERPAIMGCYGIGITRTVAAIIEQNHDENGIMWPMSISPYQVHIILLNVNSTETVEVADNLYNQLTREGVEVILDDRDERAGVKFNDADLIGIPLRLTISPKRVAEKKVEIKRRRDGKEFLVDIEQAVEKLEELIQEGG
ncbi:proline--tRNA ligase, partial [bacterium]|nr:proline--tRNA ligase [bacterium]